MSATALNNLGLNFAWALGEDAWKTGMDTNLVFADALTQSGVIAVGTNTPPGSPSQGEAHVIGSSPTGAFGGKANQFAVFYTYGATGTWFITAPRAGWAVFDRTNSKWWLFDGTAWTDNILAFVKRTVKSVTASSYTLVAADAATLVELTDGSGVTVNIPANATLALPIGWEARFAQAGAGALTFTPAGGVTMQSRSGADQTAGQHAVAMLKKVATNTWRLFGDIV